jgi:hypothetical protein
MGRESQANAPQEVILLFCQRDEHLVVRPRIIGMTPALSRYLDVLRFAAAFTVFLSHYALGLHSGACSGRSDPMAG